MTEWTLGYLAGGKEAVLTNLRHDPVWLAETTHYPGSTMERAAAIAQSIVKGRLYDMVYPMLSKSYEAYRERNGPRPPFPQEQAAVSEWDSGVDDMVAGVLEPYQDMLSGSWLGEATVDTRLHMEGELAHLIGRFAKEAWKQLTYEKNTTAKILSAVGIVEADITHLLANLKEQDISPAMELEPDMAMNAVINKIILHVGPEAQRGDVEMVCADDTDPYILPQAMGRLGIDMDDVEILRLAVMAGYDPHGLYAMVQTGELLDEAEDAADLVGATAEYEGIEEPTDDGETEGVAEPQPAPPTPEEAPAGTQVAESPAPPPKRPGRPPRKAGQLVPGQIPHTVLEGFKLHGNVRDEDAAAIIGVSRATYNNMVKGKAPFVPTDPQRAAMRGFIRSRVNGLIGVLSLFDGEPYDEIE